MALRLIEGFNYNNTDAFLSFNADWGFTSGRNGTGGVYMGDSNRVMEIPFSSPVVAGSKITFGFALNRTAWNNNRTFFRLRDDASATVMYGRAPSSGHLEMVVGGNVHQCGISSGWAYFEFEVLMHPSAGTFKAWMDGVETVNVTGQDTQDATGDVNSLWFNSDNASSDSTYYLDDIYVLDDNDGGHVARLGDVHVKTLVPSGTGAHADGVGSDGNSVDNYLLVDDVAGAGAVDDADLVELGVADREAYTLPALGVGEVPIGVRVNSRIGNGNALTSQASPSLRVGTTDYDGTAQLIASGFSWRDALWDQNPDTALAWAEDDLDAAQAGVVRSA